jgi:hypothetical protein
MIHHHHLINTCSIHGCYRGLARTGNLFCSCPTPNSAQLTHPLKTTSQNRPNRRQHSLPEDSGHYDSQDKYTGLPQSRYCLPHSRCN